MQKPVSKESLEEKLYSRNFTKFGLDLNPVVSLGAGLLVLLFSAYALYDLDQANKFFQVVNDVIISRGDWIFILSSNFFILVCFYLAVSKLGNIRLGGQDATPEFDNFSWYSMLLAAGMGIGLMFWAVGEPLYHSEVIPPIFQSGDDSVSSLATTFFHWGLHPWAIYAVVALSLAFFAFNKGLPLSLRSVFYPIFKDKVFGVIGDIIDIFTVVACLFGLATSLGLGAQQINSGLNYLTGLPSNVGYQVLIIAVITLLATISILSGINKGVKNLSKFNIRIAGLFMLLIFLLGPTAYIIKIFINSIGLYVNNFIESSFFISLNDNNTWQGDWSIFYLAWWISWSPFVGMFIARVSRGRTIREFILAVLFVPSMLSFVWLSVFGATSIHINNVSQGKLFEVVQDQLPVALFEMIQYINFPIAGDLLRILLSIMGTVLIISFFITSSDSGSIVVNLITSGGKTDTSRMQRVFWAFLEGVVSAVLLLIGGEMALSAMQTAVISTGLPFAFILIIMSIVLVKTLHNSISEIKG